MRGRFRQDESCGLIQIVFCYSISSGNHANEGQKPCNMFFHNISKLGVIHNMSDTPQHHLGGETTKISYSPSGFENWGIWGHFQDWTIPVPRMKLQLRRMQVRKLGPSSNFPEISIDIHRYHGEGKLYGYGRLWKMG